MHTLTSPRLARAADCLVRDQFAVSPGESVLITADAATERSLIDAVASSVARAGAKPLVAIAPSLPFQGGLSDPYVSDSLGAAAAASDVWLDFCFPYHAGSGIHSAAMAAQRCRYGLLAMASAASFERLYGGADYQALLDFNIAFMEFVSAAAGETVRFQCDAGTDVSFVLDKVKLKRARVFDKPGMDTVPGAQSLYPVKGSVRGRIVIQALFDEHYRKLRKPITISSEGTITGFTGAGVEDQQSFDRALRRASGKDGLGTFVHFTYGFHPAARFTGNQFIEDIRLPGSNAIGMGLPWWEPGGGENHPDGLVLDQSMWIAGLPILDRGHFVGSSELKTLYDRMSIRPD
jgi:leucyl aminopeptidase (aminopeptidase T)